ncbi:MAG: DUF5694 domain-containing protein [Candidatus Aminicenantales bacterium]
MKKSLCVLASLGLAAFVFLAVGLSVTANAQTAPPQRAEILILGTYHMANPGSRHLQHVGKRNIRIYSNIANIVESPNERVLVIYGAGHLGWLQQDVANDPALRLRKFAEFVRPNTN